MHKILGIDLGATAVKAVAIEATFRSHQLRAYRAEPLVAAEPVEGQAPETWADRTRRALEALAADDWFRADTVVCSLPAAQVATHFVTLPFTEPKRIEQTLPFEVEGLIPFDLEDVVFDWHVLSRANGKTELLVAVARKDDVAALLELLKTAGLDPAVVTFSALSLVNLYADTYLAPLAAPAQGEAAPIEAIVDIGAERTNVLLAEGGQVRFARTVSAAGAHVTRALARALSLPEAAAEEAKKSIELGVGGDPLVVAAAERAVSPLVRELRATFASQQGHTHRKVERIHLCGGGARLGGLAAFLEEALGIPVVALELGAERTFPEPEELAPAALALAMALRGVGGAKAPKLTFRRGPFASVRALGDARGRLGQIAAMAAVLLVLFGVSTWSRLHALEQRDKALDDVLCETTKKYLGKCETDYKVALGRLKGRGSPAAAVPSISAVELVDEVTQVFPQGDSAILASLDIVDDRVELRGDAKDYDAVDNLIADIQKNKCFGEVKKKGNLTKDKNGRVGFDIDAKYTCSRKAGS